MTRFRLTGEDGKVETIEAVVRPRKMPAKDTTLLILEAMVTVRLNSKKPIARVVTDTARIVRVSPAVDSLTIIYVTALQNGFCHLSLTDEDGKTKHYEVMVWITKKEEKEK